MASRVLCPMSDAQQYTRKHARMLAHTYRHSEGEGHVHVSVYSLCIYIYIYNTTLRTIHRRRYVPIKYAAPFKRVVPDRLSDPELTSNQALPINCVITIQQHKHETTHNRQPAKQTEQTDGQWKPRNRDRTESRNDMTGLYTLGMRSRFPHPPRRILAYKFWSHKMALGKYRGVPLVKCNSVRDDFHRVGETVRIVWIGNFWKETV